MQQIDLTYEQWMQVHPEYRSVIKRVPHVVAYERGQCVLMRVRFVRAAPCAAPARPGKAQLRLRVV